MKIFYFFVIFSISFSSLQGQITINSGDMPSENEVFITSNSFLLLFDEEDTGEDHVWDFSELISISQDSTSFIDLSDTPFIFQFIFNNPFDPNNQATEGKELNGLDLIPTIEIEDAYLFTKNSSSKLEELGFGVTFSGIQLPIQYDNKKTVYEFPLSYGDSISDTYSFSVTVPNFAYLGESGTRMYEVDGWGSLTTPFGTFDALRTRIEHIYEDSIYIDSSDFGISIPRSLVIYEWLGEDTGIPLLQINTEFGLVTSVVYQDSLQISTNIIENLEELSAFKIYPQPAKDYLNVELERQPTKGFEVIIYDLSGKEVYREYYDAKKKVSISTESLSPGIYMLEVQMDSYRKVNKLIIQ